MPLTQLLGAAALMVFTTTGFSMGAHAQDAPKPAAEAGCTTVNGVSTGPGCDQTTGSPDAGAVVKGMPATKHQQELLKTDGKAAGGQNMDASGAGSSALPATEHQQEVLKKPDAATDKGTTTQP